MEQDEHWDHGGPMHHDLDELICDPQDIEMPKDVGEIIDQIRSYNRMKIALPMLLTAHGALIASITIGTILAYATNYEMSCSVPITAMIAGIGGLVGEVYCIHRMYKVLDDLKENPDVDLSDRICDALHCLNGKIRKSTRKKIATLVRELEEKRYES